MARDLTAAVRDPQRLAVLARTGLLDSPPEEAFDRLARSASELLGAPVSLVSLLDGDREFLKSHQGLGEPWATRRELPFSHSICKYIVFSGAPLVVENASHHSLLHAHPAVAVFGLVAYAGVPLVVEDRVLGTVCVLDHRTRVWQPRELRALSALAQAASAEIHFRIARADAEREQQEKATILERITDAVISLDREWKLTYVNPRAERLFRPLRRTRGELVGKNLWEEFPEFVGTPGYERYHQAVREQAPQHFEALYAPSGLWFDIHAYPSPEGLVVYYRDISERKRAEERERELVRAQAARVEAEIARQHVSQILESITDGFFALDRRWRFTYVNGEGERLLQHSREELIGKHFWEDFPQMSGTPFAEHYHAAMQRQEPVTFEAPSVLVPNRWFEVRAYPAEDGLAVYFHDITERRRSEQALRFLKEASRTLASTLEYETTLERVTRLAIPVLADYCVVDIVEESGKVHRVAAAHRDTNRLPRLEALRRYSPDPTSDHPIARVLRTGEPEQGEDLAGAVARSTNRDDGEYLDAVRALGPHTYLVVPLRARGDTLGAMLFACDSGGGYDLHETTLAEELATYAALAVDNARLFRKVQRAVQARDDVLAIVSHDLRNHINAISLTTSLFLENGRERSVEEQRMLETVHRAVERMHRLMQDLLDVASIEAGRLSLHCTPHSPGALLIAAVEMARPLADERELQLTRALPEGLPPVLADSERVHQVLSNLVGNAIKFTPRHGRVQVGAEKADRGVRFFVSDTGPGIPEEHLPHLFDRFWQARNARRGGAGLGLAIAKGIVDAHGGTIGVDTVPGEGTTFWFVLRRAPSVES